ncbi:transcription termination factor 3, mitochondrial [Plakobranchus ocellatus]|uniref:Transcription termination factor 3, mitochondrial n=1 Tax=Plakobranchus ocellatus TaxID=259542 RepID=A0AAV4BT21_9GAST|nr:transcription termination factor 3, mitochondrial [Plakobranchus ocellatus]
MRVINSYSVGVCKGLLVFVSQGRNAKKFLISTINLQHRRCFLTENSSGTNKICCGCKEPSRTEILVKLLSHSKLFHFTGKESRDRIHTCSLCQKTICDVQSGTAVKCKNVDLRAKNEYSCLQSPISSSQIAQCEFTSPIQCNHMHSCNLYTFASPCEDMNCKIALVLHNPNAKMCKNRISPFMHTVWTSYKAIGFIDRDIQFQVRTYRGRMRQRERETSDMMKTDNGQLEKNNFDKDVDIFHSDLQASEDDFGRDLRPGSVDEMTIPELSRQALNLVPYVNRSETLQNLVKLGVNLDLVQRVEGVAELLLKSQFKRDIAPLIHLLNLMGVPLDEMGQMLTRNPLLFKQSIEDLSARFGYFLHKRFSQAEAVSIVVRAPVALLMDPVKLDSKLGFLQTTFGLKGHEVRKVVLKYPKVIPWRRDMIAGVRFHLKEFLAFSNLQLKELLLKEPKIYLSNPNKLTEAFDYLFTTMGITRDQIMLWPGILRTRQHIVRDRHLFLVSRNRAQYDPCLENFVSLKALGSGSDTEFCKNVAKCDEQEFHAFLKTL